ncbi:helix-turn-helix domain-containing protein [uncultured Limosilactobacillus sp.]|uniref:helix-turn-helix domain-containing protein n=1 Tax=uncultured Limosilactobacillus sp. TaxID=2837629 RepID=UPI00258F1F6E|nr:helix-turn-helix domain-containing protein [uncultured Limosilactobacillus sp.]
MNRLKILRKQKGLTQQQLSNDLKNNNILLSRAAISNYERGRMNLKLRKLAQLADYFHVSISYLKGSSDRKSSSLLDSLYFLSKSWKPNSNNNIYVERTRKGLSQNDLGRMIGVSREYISEYELGIQNPKWEIWQALAKALNSEVTYLQGINGRYYPYDAKVEKKEDENKEDIEDMKLKANKLYGFFESLYIPELSGETRKLLQKLDWAYADKAFSLLYLLIKLYGSSYDKNQLKTYFLEKNTNSIYTLESIIKSIFSMFIDDQTNFNKILDIIEHYDEDKEIY